jgi:DNA adenine methylase
MQTLLFGQGQRVEIAPFKSGLLKWIGNKQRMAHEICAYFPESFGTYYEPFVGSGAVLATLRPERAFASDTFTPLIEIWKTLHTDPGKLKRWYAERRAQMMRGDKIAEYEKVKAAYNREPNGADFLFLCRSCYAGVVRFRQADGYMSTPCGPHTPIPSESFAARVDEWHRRTMGAEFERLDYREAMSRARPGDLVYCDPPYSHSQAILYGAQTFRLRDLLAAIADCKQRGVCVALSIDGTKRSGEKVCDLPIPQGLFEREVLVDCGRSMLRRLQMGGQTLEGEVVADRLLLTY